MQILKVSDKAVVTSFCLLGFFLPISVVLGNVLMYLTVILVWLSPSWRQQLALIIRHPLSRWLFLWMGLAIVALLHPEIPWRDKLIDVQKYVKILLLLLLLPLSQRRYHYKRYPIYAFYVAMCFTAVAAYLNRYVFHWYNGYDMASLFRNHIQTTFMLSIAIYIALQAAYYSRHYWRLLHVMMALLLTSVIVLSTSRTGFLTLVVLLLTWVTQHWQRRMLALIGQIILLLGLLWLGCSTLVPVVFHNVYQHLTTFRTTTDSSTNLRLAYIFNTVELIREQPLLGSGLGSFKYRYFSRYGSVPLPDERMLRTPHNEYLFVWVQMGLLGLLALLLLQRAQWRLSSQFSDPWRRELGQAITLAFIAGFMADALLYASTTGFLWVFLSTVVMA